ncbi:MAG: hypothetical protein ACFB12_13240 [Leptolyngbyaceae cyanobacterium]
MTKTDVIQQKQIVIGNEAIEVFQLPDGSYRVGLASLAKSLGLNEQQIVVALRTESTDSSRIASCLQEVTVVSASQKGAQNTWTITPEGLVEFLQWQLTQENQERLPFLKKLIVVWIRDYLNLVLREPVEPSDADALVWQAYLESEKERKEVYLRLANS